MHYLIKLYLFTLLLAFSPISPANQNNEVLSIGAFNEPEGERSGLELSMSTRSDSIGFLASMALYSGGNNTVKVYENNEQSYLNQLNNTANYPNNFIYSDESNTNGSYKSYDRNETYVGFSVFGFIHTGQVINPYLGLGFFVGKTQNCTSDEERYEACVDNFSAAVYPEFGVEFTIVNFQVTPFIRRYFDTSDSRTSGNVYGVKIGMSF